MLPADRVQRVPPSESTECAWCGARHGQEHGLVLVSYDVPVDEELPIKTETVERGAAVDVHKGRDGFGGTTTFATRKQQYCSACLALGVREGLGWEDPAHLSAELAELQGQLEATRSELRRSEHERVQAEAALRETEVYQRLLAAGDRKPGTGKASTSKKR